MIHGAESINPDIPISEYVVVGGMFGKIPMGKWALAMKFFEKNGKWPPQPDPQWKPKFFTKTD